MKRSAGWELCESTRPEPVEGHGTTLRGSPEVLQAFPRLRRLFGVVVTERR